MNLRQTPATGRARARTLRWKRSVRSRLTLGEPTLLVTIEGAREKVYRMQELLAGDLPYVTLFTTPKVDVFRPSKVEYPYTSVLGGMAQQQGLQHVVLIK